MLKGRDVRLVVTTGAVGAVAAQTELQLEMTKEVVPVVPLPGSAEDDGWAHYECGQVRWGVQNGSFVTTNDKMMNMAVSGGRLSIYILVGSFGAIYGTAWVTAAQVDAQNKGWARVVASLEGENFLTKHINTTRDGEAG